MGSEKSPYKSFGMLGTFVSQGKAPEKSPVKFERFKPVKLGHLFSGNPGAVVTNKTARNTYTGRTQSELCVRCRKPRFAVEDKRCRGRR